MERAVEPHIGRMSGRHEGIMRATRAPPDSLRSVFSKHYVLYSSNLLTFAGLCRTMVLGSGMARTPPIAEAGSPARKDETMYTDKNFQTKKALKEAVASGQRIGIFQPGPFGGNEPKDGTTAVEGPWYPQPHKWYAGVTLKDGVIIAVR